MSKFKGVQVVAVDLDGYEVLSFVADIKYEKGISINPIDPTDTGRYVPNREGAIICINKETGRYLNGYDFTFAYIVKMVKSGVYDAKKVMIVEGRRRHSGTTIGMANCAF